MEKKMKIMVMAGILLMLLVRCGKDEIELYDEFPSVYFNGSSVSYSFIEKPDAAQDTVRLPVLITGMAADADRIFKIEAVADTNTTATPDLRLKVKVANNQDFKAGFVQSMYYQISWTARLQAPSNWAYLQTYFGPYSTRYYKFIIQVTGRSTFPYRIINPETGEYYWKTTAEVEAYSFIIRDSLDKYNADKSHPVLTHDDGKKAGQPVELPVY